MPLPESQEGSDDRTWWARPFLRRDEDEGIHRKVSFLDLFFDLVFVVAVAEIAHGLFEHPDPRGVGTFVLLFAPVWWLWINSTFYTERFETGEVSHRLFTTLQMVPIAGMAVFANGALGDQTAEFAGSYVLGRVLLIGLWLRGGYHDAPARPLAVAYAFGYGVGAAFWVASAFAPLPLVPWLWGLGLTIDLATPWATMRLQRDLPKLSTTRLPERFSLFTIIVLGESIVGTVRGVAAQDELGLRTVATGLLGLFTAVFLWWMYFDTVGWRATERHRFADLLRSYYHLPLAMGMTATGVGVHLVVGHEGEALPPSGRWIICGALAVTLATLWAMHFVLKYEPEEHHEAYRYQHLMLAGAFVLLGLGVLGGGLGPIALLAAASGVVGALVGYGAWRWALGKLA